MARWPTVHLCTRRRRGEHQHYRGKIGWLGFGDAHSTRVRVTQSAIDLSNATQQDVFTFPDISGRLLYFLKR